MDKHGEMGYGSSVRFNRMVGVITCVYTNNQTKKWMGRSCVAGVLEWNVFLVARHTVGEAYTVLFAYLSNPYIAGCLGIG